MKKLTDLTEEQVDALKEIASIGVSHATTAFAKLLGQKQKVMIKVPQLSIKPLSEFGQSLGQFDKILVGIYFRVLGKASGRILLTFNKESAMAMADILMKRQPGQTRILSEMDQSALQETGAILTAACLNALAKFLDMTLIPSVPHFIFDRSNVVAASVFEENKTETDYILIVDSEFQTADRQILGKFFLFPDEEALNAIWHALGKYVNQKNL